MTVTFDFSNSHKDLQSTVLALVDNITPSLFKLINKYGIIDMFTSIPDDLYESLAMMMKYVKENVCTRDIANSIIEYDFEVIS